MVEIILGVVALGGLFLSLILARKLLELDRRLTSTEQSLPLASTPVSLPEPDRVRPLEGLRVAVSVTQDHTHPVFANLLKDRLLVEDVSEVVLLTGDERTGWAQGPDAPDILIAGAVVCNGYAEIYYQADLSCQSPHQEICTLSEKPPHGDRQANLAIELVSKLEIELEKLVNRHERRRAIRELRGS